MTAQLKSASQMPPPYLVNRLQAVGVDILCIYIHTNKNHTHTRVRETTEYQTTVSSAAVTDSSIDTTTAATVLMMKKKMPLLHLLCLGVVWVLVFGCFASPRAWWSRRANQHWSIIGEKTPRNTEPRCRPGCVLSAPVCCVCLCLAHSATTYVNFSPPRWCGVVWCSLLTGAAANAQILNGEWIPKSQPPKRASAGVI